MSELTERAHEEWANALTHAVGTALGLVAGIVLVAWSARDGTASQIISASVFAISLVLLYSASTLYHYARSASAKARLKVLDHCAIFILIAGTYTPFTLVTLRGTWGWWLFGIIWSLAGVGVLLKLRYTGRYKGLSTSIYLAMGWLVIVAIVPLVRALPSHVLLLLFAGGLSYTLGTVFYMSKRVPYAHAIWHGFVLGGSALHYLAVYSQVVNPAR